MFGNISDTELEMFDKFFKGTMNKEELDQFTALLRKDEALHNKFKLHQILVSKIAEDGATNELLKKRFVQVSQRSRVISWIRLLVGSAAIIILGFFIIKLFSDKKLDYSQYAFNDPGLPINMGNTSRIDWSQFNVAYARKDYSESIHSLNGMPETDTVRYYKGLCYELKGETQSAINEYIKINSTKPSLYSQKAIYRTAIIYLKKDDRSNAVKFLNQTTLDSNSPYNKQAQELLKLINDKK